MNTVIYLCSGHILKNIIKKSQVVDVDEKVRKAFVFCFALLQNCVDISVFNFILFDVYKLFNMKNMNESLYTSFYKLRKEVKTHSLQSMNVNDFTTDESKRIDENVNVIFSPKESVENIKKDSPYTKYFEELLMKYASHIASNSNSDINAKKNEYYCPNLFKLIENYLHLLPMWTGCLINKTLIKYEKIKIKTRLDNNCVENNFGHIKTKLFQRNLQMPSSMSAILYDRYKLKYLIDNVEPDGDKNLGLLLINF